MPLARDRQTARRGEIERARIAAQLADDKGEVGAAQPFLDREQRLLGLRRGDMHQPPAQGRGETMDERPSGQANGGMILHPKPSWLIGQGADLRQMQSQSGRTGIAAAAEHFLLGGRARDP